jgi:hypothetical protein
MTVAGAAPSNIDIFRPFPHIDPIQTALKPRAAALHMGA